MKRSAPLNLNKEEFFEGFDNPSIQEKVIGVKIALFEKDNGELSLGLGIEAPLLVPREIRKINRFFESKYNVDEMIEKLIRHYREQDSRETADKGRTASRPPHGEER